MLFVNKWFGFVWSIIIIFPLKYNENKGKNIYKNSNVTQLVLNYMVTSLSYALDNTS